MKKQKRLLAALLALTLVLGLAAPCTAAEGEPEMPVQDDPVSTVETTVTPTTPTTPADTPDTPAETPDTPADTPDTPSETPDTPADTPDTPADTQDTPADTQDTPADTPDTPADTPDTPADTPDTPAETPDTPADTPDTPAETPDTPADTPDTPAETPDTPADTPDTPADTPDTPADTPDTPADTPDTPADTPDTPAETPDTPADTPDTPPTTPTDPETPTTPTPPTEPVDPTVPPAPTQEELDAAQKAQEEAAEREALLSQLSALLSPEEYQTLTEREPSLEELRALKASLDEAREKEELIRRLRELLPEEEQAALETMSLEELRATLSQAEAEKKAEEERLAAEAAEREALLTQLSALLSPEEYQALIERDPSLEELRALKASLDEVREKEELIQQLRELLPEEEQEGLEDLSLDELYALLQEIMLKQELFPILLADAAVIDITIQEPPPIQINPYKLTISSFTDGSPTGDHSTDDSIISKPCLITSNTQAEVKVTATATARATGGAKLMNQSTRSDDVMAAHQRDERNIFLFLELKNLTGPAQLDTAGWTTDPVNFHPSNSAVVIPRSESRTAELTIPAAGATPSYAAYRIGGDCSPASYLGEWKAGTLTDVDGTLVPGEADGAEIKIVFTFTAQQFYEVRFAVEHASYDSGFVNPELIAVTVDGVNVPLSMEDGKLVSGPVQALAGRDLTFNVQSSTQPTENYTSYSSLDRIVASIDPETAGYPKELFYSGDEGEADSISEDLTFSANTIPVGAVITVTVTVYEAYYWIK